MQPRPPRFEIVRPAAYRVRLARGSAAGAGRTLNISKGGVLFEPDQPIAVGSKLDLTVHLDGSDEAPTTLRVQGVVLRRQGGAVAVAFRKSRLERNGASQPDGAEDDAESAAPAEAP